jgi:hypothetical protein
VTNSHTPDEAATPGHDRRQFLQRAGMGAAAVGAWVAPQVLFTATAAAGCTPITKLLQIPACTCPSSGGAVTTTDSNLPACVPSGWANGRNDGVSFTCSALSGNPCHGGSINILESGCGPTEGRAVKFCPLASGNKYTCVSGTISGGTITFPLIPSGEQASGCVYIDYRITVTCCT